MCLHVFTFAFTLLKSWKQLILTSGLVNPRAQDQDGLLVKRQNDNHSPVCLHVFTFASTLLKSWKQLILTGGLGNPRVINNSTLVCIYLPLLLLY